jgi:hypothetical protein
VQLKQRKREKKKRSVEKETLFFSAAFFSARFSLHVFLHKQRSSNGLRLWLHCFGGDLS